MGWRDGAGEVTVTESVAPLVRSNSHNNNGHNKATATTKSNQRKRTFFRDQLLGFHLDTGLGADAYGPLCHALAHLGRRRRTGRVGLDALHVALQRTLLAHLGGDPVEIIVVGLGQGACVQVANQHGARVAIGTKKKKKKKKKKKYTVHHKTLCPA